MWGSNAIHFDSTVFRFLLPRNYQQELACCSKSRVAKTPKTGKIFDNLASCVWLPTWPSKLWQRSWTRFGKKMAPIFWELASHVNYDPLAILLLTVPCLLGWWVTPWPLERWKSDLQRTGDKGWSLSSPFKRTCTMQRVTTLPPGVFRKMQLWEVTRTVVCGERFWQTVTTVCQQRAGGFSQFGRRKWH